MDAPPHAPDEYAQHLQDFITPYRANIGFQERLVSGSTTAPQSSRSANRPPPAVQQRIDVLHDAANHTRRPARKKRADSSACASDSTVHDSVFSTATRSSTDGTRAVLTAPSRRSQLPQELRDDLNRQMSNLGQPLFPCEFAVYSSCPMRFSTSDTREWIDHIVLDHLRDNLPHRCVCWYCDDFTFDTQANERDLVTNFEERMQHIAMHISEEGYTLGHMRPDFHFIRHIYDKGLITKAQYDTAWSWIDGPRDVIDGIFGHDFETPTQRRQRERQGRVVHNQAAEDRRLRGTPRTLTFRQSRR